jgi:hypothetical protein
MVRVEDSELCPAEVFVDSTGEVMKWQVVVRDLPIEKCNELNVLSGRCPLIVTVELVAFEDLSFWGNAYWGGVTCDVGTHANTVVELMGYGPLCKTRGELT